jgi:restriction system protein
MPLVNVQTMLLPTLRLTAEGLSITETRKRLRQQFKITPAEAKETHAKSGKNIFINRVAWAFAYLVMGKLIELKDKGAYRITEQGTVVLNGNPAELTISELHQNG